MQAEKVSLDTSGAEGLIAGVIGIEAGLFGSSSTYIGANLVAANNSSFWYSYDGKTWFESEDQPNDNVNGITFGSNTWVAVGGSSNCRIWRSEDGIQWQSVDCAAGDNTKKTDVAFGNGVFVTTGGQNGATTIISLSYDLGETWNSLQIPGTIGELQTITFLPYQKQFYASYGVNVEIYSGLPDNSSMVSTDGVNWNYVSIDNDALDVIVKAGPSGSVLLSGLFDNGIDAYYNYSIGTFSGNDFSWAQPSQRIELTDVDKPKFAYGAGRYVSVGDDGYSMCKFYYYNSGWQQLTTGSLPVSCNGSSVWRSLTYSTAINLFVAGGNNYDVPRTTFAYSSNGITWNEADTSNLITSSTPNIIVARQ
ncbi:MAG: hypothetical protein H3C43_10185 [Leptonema sp. (in: Bacteria)]|nr:hypothetical protein [Leptonema sp. (in: bacteria)]